MRTERNISASVPIAGNEIGLEAITPDIDQTISVRLWSS
jgi:hypothetical protein